MQVAAYVATDPNMLRKFFRDNPRRVMLFFEHFSMSGEFTYGARALSRYAFAHRCARDLQTNEKNRLRGFVVKRWFCG